MNEEELKAKLKEVLNRVNKAIEENKKTYSYLPSIAKTIEHMIENISSSHEERKRISSGLGRLATDDCYLSESVLGHKIFEVNNEFRNMP